MALLTNTDEYRPYNEVLIQSDTETDNEINIHGLTLFRDTSYDNQRTKRIYGTVAAIPYRLSTERIHQLDDDYPRAVTYFGGDVIGRQAIGMIRQFGRVLNTAEERKLSKRYRPGIYEPQFTRLHEQQIKGKVGDRVYFHYLGLSDDTYAGQDNDHKRYYRVPYQNIFCFVNEGGTVMVNGYMQVEPYWDEEYQEIEVDGKVIRGKLKGDLVVGLKEAPEYRTGTILHRGPDFGEDTRATIYIGDRVVYSSGAEFKNTGILSIHIDGICFIRQ